MSNDGNDDDDKSACGNSKAYPFWIEKKWQEIIGWFMLGLVVLMSCIGHFIAYLKKRARRKHRQYVRSTIGAQRNNKTRGGRQRRARHNSNVNGQHNNVHKEEEKK